MRKLGDFLKIAGHTGHNFTRFICIEKGEGELFKMRKQITSHLRLHTNSHLVSFVLDKKVQKHPNDVNDEHQKTEKNDHHPFFVGDEIVEHGARNDGVNDADQRNCKRSQHIQTKEELMRLVV